MSAEIIHLHVWQNGPEPEPPIQRPMWVKLVWFVRIGIAYFLGALAERIAPPVDGE